MHPRRLLALVIVLGCAGLVAAPDSASAALPPRAPTLFVLRGPARHIADALTVRTRDVEWFTDRPERRAGTMTPKALVRNWQAWGFADDPPNAALTGHKLDVVVELSKPRVRGGRLRFDVAPVRGKLPGGKLGTISAFVDATSTETVSTVQIVNSSPEMTTAMVYVVAPDSGEFQMLPVAWQTTQVFPGERSSLTWDDSNQLMLDATNVEPGIDFEPEQTVSMPPVAPNQIGMANLTWENGSYSFTNSGPPGFGSGSLAVQTLGGVPENTAVALGLSGRPALVTQAFSDGLTIFPVTGLQYWLSTTEFIEQGQVFNTFETENAVQLNFTPGTTSLTATLEADGTWAVEPS